MSESGQDSQKTINKHERSEKIQLQSEQNSMKSAEILPSTSSPLHDLDEDSQIKSDDVQSVELDFKQTAQFGAFEKNIDLGTDATDMIVEENLEQRNELGEMTSVMLIHKNDNNKDSSTLEPIHEDEGNTLNFLSSTSPILFPNNTEKNLIDQDLESNDDKGEDIYTTNEILRLDLKRERNEIDPNAIKSSVQVSNGNDEKEKSLSQVGDYESEEIHSSNFNAQEGNEMDVNNSTPPQIEKNHKHGIIAEEKIKESNEEIVSAEISPKVIETSNEFEALEHLEQKTELLVLQNSFSQDDNSSEIDLSPCQQNQEEVFESSVDNASEEIHMKNLIIPKLALLSEEEETDKFPIVVDVATNNVASDVQMINNDDNQNHSSKSMTDRPGSPHPCSPQHSFHDEDSIAVFSDTTFPISNVSHLSEQVTEEETQFPISNIEHSSKQDQNSMDVHTMQKIHPSDSFESDIQDIVVASSDMVPASPMSANFATVSERDEYLSDHISSAPDMPTMEDADTSKIKRINHDAQQIIELEFLDGKPFDWDPELDEELFIHVPDDPVPSSPMSKRDKSTIDDINSMSSSIDGKRTASTTNSLDMESQSYFKSINVDSNSNSLPDANFVRNTGVIYTRTSWKALLLRKWQRCVWVHYGRASLYIFRCEEDVNTWLKDTKLTDKQRENLIKVRFDFLQELQKPNVRGYKLTSNKAKVYEKNGPFFHNFKLEKWTELDKNIAAAFASTRKKELETLRAVVDSCLKNCPHNGLKSIKDLIIADKTHSTPVKHAR